MKSLTISLAAVLAACWYVPQSSAQGVVIDGPLILAPGHSVEIADVAHPDVSFVIKAPSETALDLTRFLLSLTKANAQSAVFSAQIMSANELVPSRDGSVSLQSTAPPIAPQPVQPGPGSYMLWGGKVYVEKGNVRVPLDRITKVAEEPAAPRR
jgi:hypothetical protein